MVKKKDVSYKCELLDGEINPVFAPQIRFVMKSYSFIRETLPVVLRNTPQKGKSYYYI